MEFYSGNWKNETIFNRMYKRHQDTLLKFKKDESVRQLKQGIKRNFTVECTLESKSFRIGKADKTRD